MWVTARSGAGNVMTASSHANRHASASAQHAAAIRPEHVAHEHADMHRILLAYRAGDSARRAMYAAAQLARAVDAQVGVISVVPLYPDRGGESVAPWDDHDAHHDDLLEAQAVFRASGIEPDLIERVGDPAQVIDYEANV